MATSLESYRRARGVIQRKLTAFDTFVQGLIPVSDEVLKSVQLSELKQRMSIFENILDSFNDAHGEVIFLLADDDEAAMKAEEVKRLEFENGYYRVHSKVATFLDDAPWSSPSNSANQVPNSTLHSTANNSNASSNASVVRRSAASISNAPQSASVVQQPAAINSSNANVNSLQQIKLPKISLPTFSGQHDDWLQFRDKYASLIHTNATINDIQKFHYLRSCVSGEAAAVIQLVEFTSTSYVEAWQILCTRYDNTRVLIHNHFRSIFSNESLARESASKMRSLLDNLLKNLGALDKLKIGSSNLFELLIIYVITSKFDSTTARDWEKSLYSNQIPTLDQLKTFIREKADLLATLEIKRSIDKPATIKQPQTQTHRQPRFNTHTNLAISNPTLKCALCKAKHLLRNCDKLLALKPQERYNKIKSLNRCINCLRYGHLVNDCDASLCLKCGKPHHTILHFETNSSMPSPHCSSNTNNDESSTHIFISNTAISNHNRNNQSTKNYSTVILSTALVTILDKDNNPHTVRVLLDSCSQSNFISESLAKTLKLTFIRDAIGIIGISAVSSTTNFRCTATIEALQSNFRLSTDFVVLTRITGNVPAIRIDRRSLNIPSNIVLADPSFDIPGKIDLLLGAEHFLSLLCIGQISLGPRNPTMQKTKLGWIISGMTAGTQPTKGLICNLSSNTAHLNLNESLCKFWELEDVPDTSSFDDNECEKHFKQTTTRDNDGRFVVKIPFHNLDLLGDTYELALKRFLKLEKVFIRQPELHKRYSSFIDEYLALGHMAPSDTSITARCSYLPHHAVIKETSSTTKLRVVFDGSAKPLVGKSLNECQIVGPRVQDDLLSISLRFRTRIYAVSADITKMYRQVSVHSSQRHLQRILWRPDRQSQISSFDLNAITYGTSSASYLATRCLLEIARNLKNQFPPAAWSIEHDFFADDLLAGFDTVDEARQTIIQINDALNDHCLPLRKWRSNLPELVQGLSSDSNEILHLGADDGEKTLGICWSPTSDSLSFHIDLKPSVNSFVSKRGILSEIAKVFDPLGLLSPVVIIAKMLMQKLWSGGFGWDESLPSEMHCEWLTYRQSLPILNSLAIPRCVRGINLVSLQLHGFSEASPRAYGACVYLLSTNQSGATSCFLLTAKGKVAPLKTVSIPRLELCGALLLSRLIQKVVDSLNSSFDSIHLWCDSMVVLAWIKRCPSSLRTFVANRCAKIQNLTQAMRWNYVPTQDNPADLITRGTTAAQLLQSEVWWYGPAWLRQSMDKWPGGARELVEIPETISHVATHHKTTILKSELIIDISKFPSLSELERVMALVLRFVNNTRFPTKRKFATSLADLVEAQRSLVKIVQASEFALELRVLSKSKSLPSNSCLQCLAPFVDTQGLLRVGGRLENACVPFNEKHPILLPKSHHITTLIFRAEHERLLHVGPQGLLYAVRQRYWPISGRNAARKVVHACIKCFRAKPSTFAPKLGQLPPPRVNPSFPFYHSGVDYAGPFSLKTIHSRGCKTCKAYIAVFVCLCTKAIHLELVTDLSTPAFLAMLKRFVARRGKPSVLYSDNGTNFVGAKRKLDELTAFVAENTTNLQEAALNESISWKFKPPRSPHFGGLWEAGVKSVKHHLKRVINEQIFTYEDFYTLLVQIESVLNSRPLSPMSSDPNDLLPITPAHFIIGRPLTNIVEPHDCNAFIVTSSRYQHLQKVRNDFWKRWSKSYLNELQQQRKWTKDDKRDPKIGDLVLLNDDIIIPQQWKLGRITELHKGRDDVTRVVTVKTKGGYVKRSTRRISPLPEESNFAPCTEAQARVAQDLSDAK